jgi:hypothetical protein
MKEDINSVSIRLRPNRHRLGETIFYAGYTGLTGNPACPERKSRA